MDWTFVSGVLSNARRARTQKRAARAAKMKPAILTIAPLSFVLSRAAIALCGGDRRMLNFS
jgi:hypothetical protein